jgi:hypothetical protein
MALGHNSGNCPALDPARPVKLRVYSFYLNHCDGGNFSLSRSDFRPIPAENPD